MHEGCSAEFANGKEIVNKLRMMGFSQQPLPAPFVIECEGCSKSFIMRTHEATCHCGMVYGVTPCHASAAGNVKAAGENY